MSINQSLRVMDTESNTNGDVSDTVDEIDSTSDEVVIAEIESTAFGVPLNGNHDLVNYKGLIARSVLQPYFIEGKVGLIGSRSRLGQVVQGVGSVVLPGNVSVVRSPVRSGVARALTPGGGQDNNLVGRAAASALGRSRRAARRILRCPAGFEYGGRFASRNFANCGRQLFDLPGIGDGIRGVGRGVGLVRRRGEAFDIGDYGLTAAQIQRATQIPRVGGNNSVARNRGIKAAVAALAGKSDSNAFLVRQDGFTLRPVVGTDVLAGIRKNPDMDNGAFISRIASPAQVGHDSTPMLWMSNARSVVFVTPDGGSITVERAKDLTIGEKRKLTKFWDASAGKPEKEFDVGSRVRSLVDYSEGGLTYNERFPSLDNANDLVTVSEIGKDKNQRSVRRWVYANYMADNAPGRDKRRKWKEVAKASTGSAVRDNEITTPSQAVAFLKNNGDPFEVPPSLLGDALKRSKVFTPNKLQPGVELLERGDGKKFYRVDSTGSYSHLSHRVSADVHSVLGLESGKVGFIGSGSERAVLIEHPENLQNVKISRDSMSDLDPEDLLRIATSDFLLDNQKRSPASLVGIKKGDAKGVMALDNGEAVLAGLSAAELKRRRAAVLAEYFEQSRNEQLAKRFNELRETQRRQLLKIYDSLLDRASKFDWSEYVARLSVDGGLSAAEKQHLELVKTLFEQRLETLRSSRKRYLSILGVM